MKNIENRTGLMEVYRASFKNYLMATAQLQSLPETDPIAREMAVAEVEQARQAYSRSRDALVPALLGAYSEEYNPVRREKTAACCA